MFLTSEGKTSKRKLYVNKDGFFTPDRSAAKPFASKAEGLRFMGLVAIPAGWQFETIN